MKYLFLIVLSIAAMPVYAGNECAHPASIMDVETCAGESEDATEIKLNAAYKRLIKDIDSHDFKFGDAADERAKLKAAVVAAERLWVKSREADCNIYSGDDDADMINKANCMGDHASSRIKFFDAVREADLN